VPSPPILNLDQSAENHHQQVDAAEQDEQPGGEQYDEDPDHQSNRQQDEGRRVEDYQPHEPVPKVASQVMTAIESARRLRTTRFAADAIRIAYRLSPTVLAEACRRPNKARHDLIDPAYRAVAQRSCEPTPQAGLFPRCRSPRLSPTRSCAG
jgi:hypothetical protein